MSLLPLARLVHHLEGRTRFRVSERRGDKAYFEELRRKLIDCPTVTHIAATPLTGSLLVLHTGEPSSIAAFAREQRIFEVTTPEDADTFASMEKELRQLDKKLWEKFEGRWGLAGVTFYGLVGATALQILRGRVLPPAGTLLFQAMTIFLRAFEAEKRRDVSRLG